VILNLNLTKGGQVVDSEDLPLSISRERAQDTQLLKRIQRVLVRKVSGVVDPGGGAGREDEDGTGELME
jgi:hypothetical protein